MAGGASARRARVFRLALERGSKQRGISAVAEGVLFRLVAEAIGRQSGVPTRSVTAEEAKTHFGDLSIWVTGSGRVSSEKTTAVLGWKPQEIGLTKDIDRPGYFT